MVFYSDPVMRVFVDTNPKSIYGAVRQKIKWQKIRNQQGFAQCR